MFAPAKAASAASVMTTFWGGGPVVGLTHGRPAQGGGWRVHRTSGCPVWLSVPTDNALVSEGAGSSPLFPGAAGRSKRGRAVHRRDGCVTATLKQGAPSEKHAPSQLCPARVPLPSEAGGCTGLATMLWQYGHAHSVSPDSRRAAM